ncbi:hypothetical protein HF329_00710 [Chitinophaga oryzae]|uniref:HNH endonuclease n=1 Tax=Chitinophaga oryzae TaxID=2725414 RepID=A0AAE6ZC05_9BACT|nr:hypothetical protein [Chitinophaga oryzae]QJB29904.1 hypothetical protein HF329_00710 [Chitinophaga oryzae]
MNQNSSCLLCGKRAKLLRKSHIIPDFMYKGLFDETDRMMFMSLNDFSKHKYVQTGYYDKYILCSDCDNGRIGGWEKYAAAVLYGGGTKSLCNIEKRFVNEEMDTLFVTGISYQRFKLFLLSILWRAHTSQNKFFKQICIPDLEPALRNALVTDNAGADDDFKVGILGIKGYDGNLANFVMNPDMRRIEGSNFAHFMVSGFIYFIELKKNGGFQLLERFYLKQSGELEIPIISGGIANQMLRAFGLPDKIVDHYTPIPRGNPEV